MKMSRKPELKTRTVDYKFNGDRGEDEFMVWRVVTSNEETDI